MGNQRSKDTTKLTEKEIELMLHKTDFSREDIHEWHANFMDQHPDGCMNYQEFFELYSGVINPRDKSGHYARILFDAFDVEKVDKISLREFFILSVFQVNADTPEADEMRLDKVDEKSFNLALALWQANGNFSQTELEKIQNALAEAQKSKPPETSDDDDDSKQLDREQFRRIVESCKSIIAS